jgi:autotransporter-associated beta strand protein
VVGGPVYAGEVAKLGTGDVIVSSSGGDNEARLILRGTDNIHDQARVILADQNFGDSSGLILESAGETIGSLEGNGLVFFNRAGGSTLTMGGNDASTEFYGTISDYYQSPGKLTTIGTLVKTGSGTFALWGEARHGGGTYVEEGTFLVNGALEYNAHVTANGRLGGIGLIGGDVTLVGGTIAPGASAGVLTINGDLRMDGDFMQPASMEMELNGTTVGTLYDQLVINGNCYGEGIQYLTLQVGYNPAVNDAFTIINATYS